MPKKVKAVCAGECRWIPAPRSKTKEVCEHCDNVFPCEDETCGHIDCDVTRGSRCYRCEKKIRWKKSDMVENHYVMHSVKIFRGGWHTVHEDCIIEDDEKQSEVHVNYDE